MGSVKSWVTPNVRFHSYSVSLKRSTSVPYSIIFHTQPTMDFEPTANVSAKWHDASTKPTEDLPEGGLGSWLWTNEPQLTQGTSYHNERCGRYIRLLKIEHRGYVQKPDGSGSNDDDAVRLILVLDKQPSKLNEDDQQEDPPVHDILDDNSINSFQDLRYSGRYVFLVDKLVHCMSRTKDVGHTYHYSFVHTFPQGLTLQYNFEHKGPWYNSLHLYAYCLRGKSRVHSVTRFHYTSQ